MSSSEQPRAARLQRAYTSHSGANAARTGGRMTQREKRAQWLLLMLRAIQRSKNNLEQQSKHQSNHSTCVKQQQSKGKINVP